MRRKEEEGKVLRLAGIGVKMGKMKKKGSYKASGMWGPLLKRFLGSIT